MDFFKQLLQQISSIWQRLETKQKIAFVLSLGAFLVTLFVFLSWATRPEYSLLYSDLSLEDAGQITKKLKEQNIPYQLKNGGKSIYVPASQVYETRLDLAMEGIPSGKQVGFEIFDNTGLIGMTNFMERINYQRALQGELARTIESLDEVLRARVHLVLPEKSPFIGESSHPRASVVLKLRPGARLRKNQVMGIARLVMGSVEDMQLEDVSIIDQRGEILFGGEEISSPLFLTANQIELKKQIEGYLTDKVQTLLASVLGAGKAVVRVDTKLNFDQIKKTQEYYDPEGKVITSEMRKEESSEGGKTVVGGAPGVKTNMGQANVLNMGNPGKQTKEESSVQYAVNRTVEQIVKGIGNIERISVAVAVDGTYKILSDGKKEYVPRSEKEIQNITSIIKQAVGCDESRGDKVVVTNVPFDASVRGEGESQWQRLSPWEWLRFLSRYIIIAVVILVLFLSLRTVVKFLVSKPQGREIFAGKEEDFIPFEDESWLKERVFKLAGEEPGRVAKIIKIWMTNHERG
ncbi:flagellar M-ring protein FliF [Candidatus Aerophobetes bacterium]|nr:flagellar M-ring protein FliF [Candidatus Aerophobetes bacterium]